MPLVPDKITDCPNRPNTMLDKVDNIVRKSDLDSVENRDGHRYLTLISTSAVVASHSRDIHPPSDGNSEAS